MNAADEIQKLHALRESGAISEEEYQKAKEAVLSGYQGGGEKVGDAVSRIASNPNTWGMFIHLSQFFGYLVPMAGLVVPIILWQMKKEYEIIDRHGRIVANWIISEIIYILVSGILCAILIGIPLLLAVLIMGIVFPIIGGVKAGNGEVWPYPLSIKFFPVPGSGQASAGVK